MGSLERRDRERTLTRQRILDAARDLFVESGYEATTMRAVADRIEFTPTAIYHHFKNKEALLVELCQLDFRALADVFQKIGRIEDPIERIGKIGEGYVNFALENPRQYRFMFFTERPTVAGQELVTDPDDPSASAYAFLRDSVAEAMAAGRYRAEFTDPDQVAQMLWGAMHGIVSIRMAKEHDGMVKFRDTRQTAVLMREVLTRGLTAK